MATHTLTPIRAHLHGYFSRDLPPAVTVAPGDSVTFEAIPDAAWNVVPASAPGAPSVKWEPRTSLIDDGHCLMGPVAVQGAERGMTLKVTVNEVVPAARGWTASGGWPHPVHERLGTVEQEAFLYWQIDTGVGTATNQHGHQVKLAPFLGVMGMPPALPGRHPTPPPRATGGNLDCKLLTRGSSLYLPVAVPGGLFSCGDGHAAQGDGEVCVTAIECPLDRVSLTFDLLPDLRLTAPRADTAEGFVTFGLHEDLNEATYLALEVMVDHMAERYALPRVGALALASVTVDLRVTQIVNGVRGVHAILPHDAVTMAH